MAKGKSGTRQGRRLDAKEYRHPESESLMRPEIGTQRRFKKKLPPPSIAMTIPLPLRYRGTGRTPRGDKGEWLLALIEEAFDSPGSPAMFVAPTLVHDHIEQKI
jgi:hypothetical protein